MQKTRRYAVVGASHRALSMYCKPIQNEYSDVAELVGLMDLNVKRMKVLNSFLNKPVPIYTDFQKMIKERQPDSIIVVTKDLFHHQYIISSLNSGLEVITEKPMTIDDAKCRAILDAEKRSGRKITVTFNYRFTPLMRKLKQLLLEEKIGKLESIDFHWYLDIIHGADYFRRWHRRMENSGGLLVHKATHHFDLVNWLISSEPETVFANGKLSFYGPTRRESGERCLTCKYKGSCKFYFDLSKDEKLKRLYLETEEEDHYIRDACVFSDKINIYDNMSVLVKYKNNLFLTYSMVAYAPYEGWRMNINGDRGRIDIAQFERIPASSKNNLIDKFYADFKEKDHIYIFPLFEEPYTVSVDKIKDDHGGGDKLLRDVLFRDIKTTPPRIKAGSKEGAMSLLIGVAANKSILTGKPVSIENLLG